MPAVLERIQSRLAAAERDGVARFGLHRQDSALMTCLVASPMLRNHVHFIDGAAGGYAMAAAASSRRPLEAQAPGNGAVHHARRPAASASLASLPSNSHFG